MGEEYFVGYLRAIQFLRFGAGESWSGVSVPPINGFKGLRSQIDKVDDRLPAQTMLSIVRAFWVCQEENDTLLGVLR
jgi:hypothetical protein